MNAKNLLAALVAALATPALFAEDAATPDSKPAPATPVERLGVTLEDALRMASLNPALFLKRDHDLGRIKPGYLANLVHLGDDLQVLKTWIGGK